VLSATSCIKLILSWFPVFNYTTNIKHTDDEKFISVSSRQKFSKLSTIVQSYTCIVKRRVQFVMAHSVVSLIQSCTAFASHRAPIVLLSPNDVDLSLLRLKFWDRTRRTERMQHLFCTALIFEQDLCVRRRDAKHSFLFSRSYQYTIMWLSPFVTTVWTPVVLAIINII